VRSNDAERNQAQCLQHGSDTRAVEQNGRLNVEQLIEGSESFNCISWQLSICMPVPRVFPVPLGDRLRSPPASGLRAHKTRLHRECQYEMITEFIQPMTPTFRCSWQLKIDPHGDEGNAHFSSAALQLASGVYSPPANESGPCELQISGGNNVRIARTHCARGILGACKWHIAAAESDFTSCPGCDPGWTAGLALQRQSMRAIHCRLLCRYDLRVQSMHGSRRCVTILQHS
jgi:hypothetical protein